MVLRDSANSSGHESHFYHIPLDKFVTAPCLEPVGVRKMYPLEMPSQAAVAQIILLMNDEKILNSTRLLCRHRGCDFIQF